MTFIRRLKACVQGKISGKSAVCTFVCVCGRGGVCRQKFLKVWDECMFVCTPANIVQSAVQCIAHTHTHTHTYTHTHTHTHTQTLTDTHRTQREEDTHTHTHTYSLIFTYRRTPRTRLARQREAGGGGQDCERADTKKGEGGGFWEYRGKLLLHRAAIFVLCTLTR